MARCCNADGGHDDQDELDAVESSTPVAIGEVAKEELATDRAEEGEQVNDEAGPF